MFGTGIELAFSAEKTMPIPIPKSRLYNNKAGKYMPRGANANVSRNAVNKSKALKYSPPSPRPIPRPIEER